MRAADAKDAPLSDLVKDPYLIAAGLLVVVVSFPLLAPSLASDFWINEYHYYFDAPLLALTAFVLWQAASRATSQQSQLFWNYLAAGFAFWLCIRLGGPWLMAESRAAILATDLLYLTFYLFLILAFQLSPHQRWQAKDSDLIRQLEHASATLLGFGLLIYFIVIPATYDPVSLFTTIPSSTLYAVLNLYLLTRVIALRNAANREPWRSCFNLLLAATIGFVVLDGFDLASRIDQRLDAALQGTLVETLWLLPIIGFIAAARLFVRRAPGPGENGQGPDTTRLVWKWRGKLTYLAIAPLLIHVAMEILQASDEQTRMPREILVVCWAIAAMLLGALYDRRLLRYQVELEERHDQVNQQLAMVQRMDAVNRLAGGIAHDFNNLLMVIQGFADTLVFRLEDNEGRSSAEQIVKASQRASDLTRQLLALGRKQTGAAVPFRPVDALEHMVPMLQRVTSADLHLQLALDETGYVLGEQAAFEDAVLNLFLNARDASHTGGTINVRSGRRPLLDNGITSPTAGAPALSFIAIEDAGKGMDEETVKHIFEPFFSKREGGSGLGLSMVYSFAREAGGNVEVVSEIDVGSAFTIILPECDPPLSAVADESGAESTERIARTILLVEDEAAVRHMLKIALEHAGNRVLEACDGDEALRVLAASDRPVDLVVTDVVMPNMDGASLARRLLEIDETLPIIFMTGYAAGQLDRLGDWAKTAPVLNKPFTAAELLRQIEEMLDVT